jgi:hypothetical protein
METLLMQPSYRAIFTEILLAEAAAVGAFAVVAGRFAALMGGECQAALVALATQTQPKVENAGLSQPARSRDPRIIPAGSANYCRALAGLPRASVLTFLSQYDDLRGRRGVVRD